MAVLRLAGLPEEALAAAARFHAVDLPQLSPPPSGEDLVLVFPPADHTHSAWRLAAVQALARKFAPVRVNAIVGDSEPAIAAAVVYLEGASAVTGHLLELDDTGAGEVVTSTA